MPRLILQHFDSLFSALFAKVLQVYISRRNASLYLMYDGKY